jgi:predicted MPP superfamily phosphohydrolase
MTKRMLQMMSLSIGLLSLGEVLLIHWALLATSGSGLSLLEAFGGLAAVGAANAMLLTTIRKRLRARGMARVLSRGWILTSVGALFAGVLLGAVFLVVGGGAALVGVRAEGALVWLGGAAIALGFGSVAWGASVGNYRVRVDRVALPLPGAPEPIQALRIAHITDLHIGPLLPPERLGRFVDRVNAVGADLIVLTGDIFDFDPAYVEAGCRELGKLEARHGVYAVLGNHDVYTGAEEVAGGLRSLTSIRLLRDEWELVDVGGASFAIAGVDDPGLGWTERESENPAIERLAEEIPDHLHRLLLVHRPAYFAHAARLGFPVVLAGHTHGGQVAVPFAHHWNPSRMISHRTRGRFHHEESTLYVSRGLGMAGLPLRINCPREIALLQLVDARPRV